MMRTVKLILVWLFTVVSFAATYLPLYASWSGVNMWGIAWQIWAMIGFTVFWVTIGIVIWQLHSEIKHLTDKDTELERKRKALEIKEKELNIEKLEIDKKHREDNITKIY